MMTNNTKKAPFEGVNSQEASWDETLRLEVQDLVGRLFCREPRPDPADKMQWDRQPIELTKYVRVSPKKEPLSQSD